MIVNCSQLWPFLNLPPGNPSLDFSVGHNKASFYSFTTYACVNKTFTLKLCFERPGIERRLWSQLMGERRKR